MMIEFVILIQGYAHERDGVLIASPTTVLIESGGLKILVDPGANPQRLLDALKKEDLTPDDIDVVFVTHHHLDHVLNIRLFPHKDIYDGVSINRGDRIMAYSGSLPDTDVAVIPTPGHTEEHWSLHMKTRCGHVVVAGDVFWWYDDEKQEIDRESLITHEDLYAQDQKALRASRKKLLEIADYLIPGHGRPFEVER